MLVSKNTTFNPLVGSSILPRPTNTKAHGYYDVAMCGTTGLINNEAVSDTYVSEYVSFRPFLVTQLVQLHQRDTVLYNHDQTCVNLKSWVGSSRSF